MKSILGGKRVVLGCTRKPGGVITDQGGLVVDHCGEQGHLSVRLGGDEVWLGDGKRRAADQCSLDVVAMSVSYSQPTSGCSEGV